MVEELCDYVNESWNRAGVTAIHLGAYVLWRLNWIHPFTDGNGRTSRAASYLVLCLKLGYRLPGTKTIPDQISIDKTPYYKALEAADKAWHSGTLDLSAMEGLLSELLARQLYGVHQDATGGQLSGGPSAEAK
jgi:Fic family protein